MRYSKQIEQLYYDKLRQMTGEERLRQSFELNRFAWKIAEAGIRNQFPNISEKDLKEKLKQRLSYWSQFKSKLELWQKTKQV